MSTLCKNYLYITFLIMVLSWGTCVILSLNGIFMTDHYILYIPYLIGAYSPTIASFFVLKKNKKVKNIKKWLVNVFDFKQSISSYCIVVLFGILLIVPQWIVAGYVNDPPLYQAFLATPMMVLGGGMEEAGWRYILQPELEKKYNFTLSTILVFAIWVLWHLPLFFIQGVPQFGSSYLIFCVGLLGSSFAYAAIRKITKSVWLCILFHCIGNSFAVNDSMIGAITSTVILITVSYILVCRTTRIILQA